MQKYNLKTTFLGVGLLVCSSVQARSSEIIEWTHVIPEKGYILSIDLYNKNCSDIWNKQIREFMEKNPDIKNPDYILVNQKILVQRCKAEKTEEKQSNNSRDKVDSDNNGSNAKVEAPLKLNTRFISFIYGKSSIGEGVDLRKEGHNVGFSAGHMFRLSNSLQLDLGIGLMKNTSKTEKNGGTEYKIETYLLSVDSNLFVPIGDKLKLGPAMSFYFNNVDSSLSEKNKNQKISGYGGLAAEMNLTESILIRISGSQKVTELERRDLISNIGLKFEFQ